MKMTIKIPASPLPRYVIDNVRWAGRSVASPVRLLTLSIAVVDASTDTRLDRGRQALAAPRTAFVRHDDSCRNDTICKCKLRRLKSAQS